MGGGFTAPLGKSIAIGARALVFYRVVMVALTMAVVMVRRRVPFRTSPRRLAELVAVGALVGCHWVTFCATIKLAGIAVAVVCLSTGTFFTALLEPLILRRRVRWHELVLGAGVVLGVGLLLRFEVGASLAGYALGLFAALCGAAFGTWNARLGKLEPREKITFIELSSAAVFVGVSFALTGGFVPPTAVSPRARAPARPRARAPARLGTLARARARLHRAAVALVTTRARDAVALHGVVSPSPCPCTACSSRTSCGPPRSASGRASTPGPWGSSGSSWRTRG